MDLERLDKSSNLKKPVKFPLYFDDGKSEENTNFETIHRSKKIVTTKT